MSNTLSLATRLRGQDETSLREIVVRRAIAPASIDDFFDLAAALLDRTNIQQALSQLDRSCLSAVLALTEVTTSDERHVRVSAVADRLGLSEDEVRTALHPAAEVLLLYFDDDTAVLFDAVHEQVLSWPIFGLPTLRELEDARPPSPPVPVTAAEVHACDRLAAERAFAATSAVTELLLELEREPARELAKGGVALPDKKRLANALVVDLDTVITFLTVAENAGLVGRESSSYLPTPDGTEWLTCATSVRWQRLATGWLSHVHPEIVHSLTANAHDRWGAGLRERLNWRYPVGGEWLAQGAEQMERDAELLGIIAYTTPSSFGSTLLIAGADAAAAALTPLLPAEVSQVYLQNDLSIVAPGPVAPEVDARLRMIATAENRALAATYRVSAPSINRALAAGATAQSMLEFLAEVSVTGVPQPLHYVITECAARYGIARVSAHPEGGTEARTRIRSADTNLLGTMMVDQTLSALSLHRADARTVTSRHPLDTVFWALSDARYPVAAENSAGEIMPLTRRRVARPRDESAPDPVDALLQRVRAGGDHSPEHTEREWTAKQVDAAIRAKVPLMVTVALPGGGTSEHLLEPVGMSGGRVRALDRQADSERTLPLTSIVAVRPA